MNRCAYQRQQQKALVGFGCVGEMNFSMANSNGVVCPKPRRIVNVNDPLNIRPPSRLLHTSNQNMEACESRAGTELLDIILTKGGYGVDKRSFEGASSPPFFSGSPPIRASNPVIQDEKFGKGKLSPLSPSFVSMDSPSSLQNSSGGCVRVKYGHNQAPVRVEGFNCRRNCSISAVA